VKLAHHFLFFDNHDRARRHGGGRRHALGLPGQATLAKKVRDVGYRDDRLLSA
jgi:hypothetical protein